MLWENNGNDYFIIIGVPLFVCCVCCVCLCKRKGNLLDRGYVIQVNESIAQNTLVHLHRKAKINKNEQEYIFAQSVGLIPNFGCEKWNLHLVVGYKGGRNENADKTQGSMCDLEGQKTEKVSLLGKNSYLDNIKDEEMYFALKLSCTKGNDPNPIWRSVDGVLQLKARSIELSSIRFEQYCDFSNPIGETLWVCKHRRENGKRKNAVKNVKAQTKRLLAIQDLFSPLDKSESFLTVEGVVKIVK